MGDLLQNPRQNPEEQLEVHDVNIQIMHVFCFYGLHKHTWFIYNAHTHISLSACVNVFVYVELPPLTA